MQLKCLLGLLIIVCILAKNEALICKLLTATCFTYPQQNITSFKYCRLRFGRNDNYVDIYALLKQAVKSIKLTFRLFKRSNANGWRPFMYNFTIDFCKFLKRPKSRPVANFFYKVFSGYSNLNHTCPFQHDLILENFHVTAENMNLPFPSGEYAIHTYWEFNGKLSLLVNSTCVRTIDGYAV